jgi:hypothetical protein
VSGNRPTLKVPRLDLKSQKIEAVKVVRASLPRIRSLFLNKNGELSIA